VNPPEAVSFPFDSRKAVCVMPSTEILHVARTLHHVSDRLDALAGENPVLSEALVTISGNVRHNAALLEVLVVTKMGPHVEPGEANA